MSEPPASHLQPGTDRECPYEADKFCNKCGWVNVSAIVHDAAQEDPGLRQRMEHPEPPDSDEA
ncbi:MAG TPA: hypothetical protein VGH53_02695 [Streptosporangiaceae bacterium]|jgi:hypothetical protein